MSLQVVTRKCRTSAMCAWSCWGRPCLTRREARIDRPYQLRADARKTRFQSAPLQKSARVSGARCHTTGRSRNGGSPVLGVEKHRSGGGHGWPQSGRLGRKQAETRRRAAEEAIRARIPETWVWLLAPGQDDPRNAAIEWVEFRLGGGEPLAVRAAKKLVAEGALTERLGGIVLRSELDRIPLWGERAGHA